MSQRREDSGIEVLFSGFRIGQCAAYADRFRFPVEGPLVHRAVVPGVREEVMKVFQAPDKFGRESVAQEKQEIFQYDGRVAVGLIESLNTVVAAKLLSEELIFLDRWEARTRGDRDKEAGSGQEGESKKRHESPV